jgi:hypothetical protein
VSHHDGPAATAFLRDFVEASERLADHGIVILRLHTDWAAFGSWVLEAQRAGGRGAVVRATWDGRDGALEVSQPGSSRPSRQRFDSAASALQHLEAVLIAELAA